MERIVYRGISSGMGGLSHNCAGLVHCGLEKTKTSDEGGKKDGNHISRAINPQGLMYPIP